MNFEKLRHRIVFLKPVSDIKNSMGETVPTWQPINPAKNLIADSIYLQSDAGKAVFVDADGKSEEFSLKAYQVRAGVAPMTGREYEEAQKLRAETTYNVITRYFDGITPDMKILFRDNVFDIVSVLDIECRKEQLKIVAKERDVNGC